jgi:hypothetical protein
LDFIINNIRIFIIKRENFHLSKPLIRKMVECYVWNNNAI